ncbi:MAG TPA: hypothetical protein VGF84_09155 [Micromonosporaceae bacterium]
MGTILLISASFGGGHDVAARRIADQLGGLGYGTRVVDLLSLLPGGLGPALRHGYRVQLGLAPASWTWMCDASGRPRVGGAAATLARLAAPRLLDLITADTAAVVSTYPLASQLLGQLRSSGELAVPAVTVLTDMSVHRLWINAGVDGHVAMHPVAAAAAHRLGARGVTIGGPLVSNAFRPAADGEQRAARITLGLPTNRPLALVAAGSWGVGQLARSAIDIEATGLATPVVACGRNRAGRMRLATAGIGIPLGWIDDMPGLFHACDVVVQSGGGLSAQEALACGKPVLTYRCLPGHGRSNAAALDEAGWAPWVRGTTGLEVALAGTIGRHATALDRCTPRAADLIAAIMNPRMPERRHPIVPIPALVAT